MVAGFALGVTWFSFDGEERTFAGHVPSGDDSVTWLGEHVGSWTGDWKIRSPRPRP